MGKLTKPQLAAHQRACALLALDRPLTLDERHQIYADWHEGADNNQTASSAYFTPLDMASDLRIEMPQGGTLIDLCAGTGRLAFFAGGQGLWEEYRHNYDRIVCVERNPAYIEVGRRLFPDAEWICADVLDPAWRRTVGTFDKAIMNPPFGATTKSQHSAPRYNGAQFDLAVMDVAATLSPDCIAIVPRDRAPWDWRGDYRQSKHADAFKLANGLGLWRFTSLTPDYYRDQWRGVAPSVDIVGFGDGWEAEGHSWTNEPAPQPIEATPEPAPPIVPTLAQLRAAAPMRGRTATHSADVVGLPLFQPTLL